ncbi:JAZF1 family protein [Megaselia abdita]
MAVFLINVCKFNGCGLTFPSLGDLIQHIEFNHIDYDPKVIEQKEQSQPACLPLSYVLRFISDATRGNKESQYGGTTGVDIKRKLAIKHHSYSMSSSNRSNTPTGSEIDEDEMLVSESEDSNDSWTTEEFSSEFIMRYGSRHSGSNSGAQGNEKPFACPVPGCKKRYKNVNGIKYHSKNGHKKDGKVRKGYKCHCGKSYKTAQGLKAHALQTHNNSSSSSSSSLIDNMVNNISIRSSSPSQQSIGSLSPSSISNSSSYNANNNNNSLLSSSSPNPTSYVTTSQQTAQQTQTNSGNVIARSNYHLISIKTTNGKSQGQGGQSKILKLTTNGNGGTVDGIVVDNVNLGILTPATSPNKPQQIFQTTPQQSNYSTPVSTPTTTTYKFENLPMTPISPNMQPQQLQQKSATTTTHQQQQQQTTNLGGSLAIGSIITSGPATTGGNNNNSVSSCTSNSNSFELTATAIQAATVGNQIELISNDCT